MQITDKVMKAVEESLPQMQVTAIRKALTELDTLRERNKDLESEMKRYREMYTEERERVSELQAEIINLQDENVRVKDENQRLFDKDVQNRVTVMQAQLSGVNETVDKFLKNTIYRETLQHQVVDEYPNIQYVYEGGQNVQRNMGVIKTNKGVTDKKTTSAE